MSTINAIQWFVYDKFSSGKIISHGFSNLLVKPYTIEKILTLDNKKNTITNDVAISVFNTKFKDNGIIEPLDYDLYTIKLISTKENDTEFIFTIVGINIDKFDKLCRKKISIPNANFLSKLCRFHNCYIGGGFGDTKNNIQTFIDKIMTKKINVNDPTVSSDKVSFIKMKLFEYQKKTIQWMLNRELNTKSIPNIQFDDMIIGNSVYNFTSQQYKRINEITQISIKGGSLIDEMGLGKTVQATATAILNPLIDTSYIQNGRIKSRATLILCPNHLCGQWVREFSSMIHSKHMPDIKPLITKVHFDKYTYQDVLDADFIVLSYSFLGNKVFLDQWMPQVSPLKKYHIQPIFDTHKVQNVIDKIRSNLIANPIKMLEDKHPNLLAIDWHRIIVDEFHEIYTCTKHEHMKNILKLFNCTYKWCVTGTPFNKNEECLIHMVDFLSHYEIHRNNITFNDNIMSVISNECFRRNTKNSVKDEFVLPPIQEEIIWLKFTPTERMMYTAYLADPSHDEFSVYLRQLCCHPNLADETKTSLASCKTMEEIEKTMLQHYKNDFEQAQKVVNDINFRIKKYTYIIREHIYYKINVALKRIKKTKKYDDDSDTDDDSEDDNDIIDYANDAYDEEQDKQKIYDMNELISPSLDDIILCLKTNNIGKNYDYCKKLSHNDLLNVVIQDLIVGHGHMKYGGLCDGLKNWTDKLDDAMGKLKGKETTYNFYKNAIEKVKKIIPKEDGQQDPMDIIANQTNESSDLCSICLGDIPDNEICITICGHIFCYSCIHLIVSKQGACPFCKTKLLIKDLSIISYERKKKSKESQKSSKSGDKTKDELINELGTKLANLIIYIRENPTHTIIFSQWDDLLHRVGALLSKNGILNTFCRGNAYSKDKAIREFNTNDKIKVIMLSSDSAASGTNLTKAKQIILLDPVYGTKDFRKNTEGQAIGRAHRLGQTEPIKIVRFIIKDSVEEKIYNKNMEDDKAISTSSDEDIQKAINLSLGIDSDTNNKDKAVVI